MSDLREPLPPPPGWGTDSLTEFLEMAHRNRFATFVKRRDSFDRLARLDACFMRVAKDWVNPGDILAPFLFLRSHAAYRAACEHSLAGQVTEAFPQIRVCLEYAAYGLHIHENPGVAEKWLSRHDDETAMNEVKREFRVSRIRATIADKNRHAADVFAELYDRSIDWGAHPNEGAITGNLSIADTLHGKTFKQTYLHGDGPQLTHALRTTAQSGVCALEIFREVFPARFELLGVRAELLELRKGL